jgi:predicted ATPase
LGLASNGKISKHVIQASKNKTDTEISWSHFGLFASVQYIIRMSKTLEIKTFYYSEQENRAEYL